MKEENARMLLQRAEAQIAQMRVRLESNRVLLQAAKRELTAYKNEVERYRKASLPVRLFGGLLGVIRNAALK